MFFSQEEKREGNYWRSTQDLVLYFTLLRQHNSSIRKVVGLCHFSQLSNWGWKKVNGLLKVLRLLSTKARVLTLFYALRVFLHCTFPLDTASGPELSPHFSVQSISVEGSSPQYFQLGWDLLTIGTCTSIVLFPVSPTPQQAEWSSDYQCGLRFDHDWWLNLK